jgi:hypothetical protein
MGGWAPLAAPRSLHPLRADSPSSPIAIAAINLTGMMVRKDNCGEYRDRHGCDQRRLLVQACRAGEPRVRR